MLVIHLKYYTNENRVSVYKFEEWKNLKIKEHQCDEYVIM